MEKCSDLVLSVRNYMIPGETVKLYNNTLHI